MAKKGVKSTGGRGELWEEPKSVSVSVKLTPTAKKLLEKQCDQLDISQGELFERYLRGVISSTDVIESGEEQVPIGRRAVDDIDILEALPKLSFKQLGRIVSAIGRLLYRMQQSSEGSPTLAALLAEWDLQDLAVRSRVSLDQLRNIASGGKPQLVDLSRLETHIGKTLEELYEIYYRDFGLPEDDRSEEPNGTTK